jgi:N-(2-amino-2-carboxyethyl)-L-glutamate synthase
VTERDDTGGFLKTRVRMVDELRRTNPGAFWTNQYANVDGMEAHYRLTAGEICQSGRRFDFVFLAVSSAGTIAGVSRRLKEHMPSVKIIAVDAEGSVIFGGCPKKRYIPGMGASMVPDLLQHAAIDDVVHVSELDTTLGCRDLLERHGIFAGGSSGSAFAAVNGYFAAASISTRPSVLFLCCDRGVAYLDTVYNDTWLDWLRRESEGRSPAAAV